MGERWSDAKEVINATKVKLGPDDAVKLLKKVSILIASKGKTSVAVDLKKPPTLDELLALLIGPTGNLRAPTVIAGNTMYVGFNPDAYAGLI